MRKKLHKSPDQEMQILWAGAHSAAKGVDYPPHQHTDWELIYYRSGALQCVMAGQESPGYPGLIWLTPPGTIHAERAVKAYANFYVLLKTASMPEWPAFFDDDADRSVERICRQLVIESGRVSPDRNEMLALLAKQLKLAMNRVASEKIVSRPAQIVAKAERLIEERYSQPLTISEVAESVYASPSALRDYFRAVRRCSPKEHLQQVRLSKAIGFLRTSTLKLEAVAELCGYDSASHLTRCVKKAMGKTPGQLRVKNVVTGDVTKSTKQTRG